jgi:hypothetical protein
MQPLLFSLGFRELLFRFRWDGSILNDVILSAASIRIALTQCADFVFIDDKIVNKILLNSF